MTDVTSMYLQLGALFSSVVIVAVGCIILDYLWYRDEGRDNEK